MIVLVMGVAGVGKTTLGEALARRLGWPFLDADDFHPPQNVAKMKAGIPLDDADRAPWLDRLNTELRARQEAVLACSALKAAYRERLAQGLPDFRVIFLSGKPELIRERLQRRQHRYMPAALLESQFAALEPPAEAITVDVALSPAECLAAMLARLPPRPPAR